MVIDFIMFIVTVIDFLICVTGIYFLIFVTAIDFHVLIIMVIDLIPHVDWHGN